MNKNTITATCVLSAVFSFLAPVCAHAQGITAQQKKELIDYHNKVRSEVGVGPVTWSDKATAVAQKWADYLATSGQFKHNGQRGSFGENIAIDGSVMEGAQAWYNEINDYRPGVKMGQPGADYQNVGHYTQMVWSNTQMIGAGVAVMKTGEFEGQVVLVCNYDPPGNYTGEVPYDPGAKAMKQPFKPAPQPAALGGVAKATPLWAADQTKSIFKEGDPEVTVSVTNKTGQALEAYWVDWNGKESNAGAIPAGAEKHVMGTSYPGYLYRFKINGKLLHTWVLETDKSHLTIQP